MYNSHAVSRSKVRVRGGREHTLSAEPGGRHTTCFQVQKLIDSRNIFSLVGEVWKILEQRGAMVIIVMLTNLGLCRIKCREQSV